MNCKTRSYHTVNQKKDAFRYQNDFFLALNICVKTPHDQLAQNPRVRFNLDLAGLVL